MALKGGVLDVAGGLSRGDSGSDQKRLLARPKIQTFKVEV